MEPSLVVSQPLIYIIIKKKEGICVLYFRTKIVAIGEPYQSKMQSRPNLTYLWEVTWSDHSVVAINSWNLQCGYMYCSVAIYILQCGYIIIVFLSAKSSDGKKVWKGLPGGTHTKIFYATYVISISQPVSLSATLNHITSISSSWLQILVTSWTCEI